MYEFLHRGTLIELMASPDGRSPSLGVVKVPQHVVYRNFVSETVLLNLRTGTYHGLNRTAGRMLEVLDDVGDLRVAVQRLAADFDQPVAVIEQDLERLCAGLLARELIVIEPANE